MMTAGGDYEASLLLFDDIWRGGKIKMNGDIVVAVPAKDALLITGSKSRKGIAAVRELAAKYKAESRYEITDTLFVYRNGRFVKFGRKQQSSDLIDRLAHALSRRCHGFRARLIPFLESAAGATCRLPREKRVFMQIFLFDLLPFDRHFDEFKPGRHHAVSAAGRAFRSGDRGALLRAASRGVGGDGPARLRRRRAERAPHHAARADELAQHDGGGRRAAHQEAQVLHPRQPAAAAQSAAHRRRARDGGLHFARPHHGGLRARRAARIQGL